MTKKVFTTEQAKEIGEKLGIDWSLFDVEQFKIQKQLTQRNGFGCHQATRQ